MKTNIILEACRVCTKPTHLTNDDGVSICEPCSYDGCNMCLIGDGEVELDTGDYVCANCYSGLIDNATDYYEER